MGPDWNWWCLSLHQSCLAQQVTAFSQQLGRVYLGTAWFKAQHHPARLERGRVKGEQMGMKKTAQAIAHHGPLADLATDHNGTTPR
jgi:hypothetical protein